MHHHECAPDHAQASCTVSPARPSSGPMERLSGMPRAMTQPVGPETGPDLSPTDPSRIRRPSRPRNRFAHRKPHPASRIHAADDPAIVGAGIERTNVRRACVRTRRVWGLQWAQKITAQRRLFLRIGASPRAVHPPASHSPVSAIFRMYLPSHLVGALCSPRVSFDIRLPTAATDIMFIIPSQPWLWLHTHPTCSNSNLALPFPRGVAQA